jgi:hypothetical protein
LPTLHLSNSRHIASSNPVNAPLSNAHGNHGNGARCEPGENIRPMLPGILPAQ